MGLYFKKSAAKDVGRNLVLGFVTGAIAGAKIRAVGGAVVLPGVGTANGVVGGAISGLVSVVCYWLYLACYRLYFDTYKI